MLYPLEFAALLSAARRSSPKRPCSRLLLGMLGLRVSEACAADITDIRYESGYELLHVIGKGAKPADIPLPIPVLRAIRQVIDGRTSGPILRTRTGRRMDRAGASRALTRAPGRPGSATRSARTVYAGPSAPPGSSPASPSATCGRPCATPTPDHSAVRHGQGQPRPARCSRCCRLPRGHEHRLTPLDRSVQDQRT